MLSAVKFGLVCLLFVLYVELRSMCTNLHTARHTQVFIYLCSFVIHELLIIIALVHGIIKK